MSFGQRFKTLMMRPMGGPLRWTHRAGTRTILAGAAVLDGLRNPAPSAEDRAMVAQRLTMAVKTFERPAVARRLVRTARRIFDGRIVLADDSRQPMTHDDPFVDVLPLPFNSGVPHGRNAALDATTTEYILVTDDDVVFTRGLDLARAVRYLDDYPEVDIVAFVRIEVPRWYFFDHGPHELFAPQPLKRPFGELIGGLPVRAKTEQLYVARTAAIAKVRWDENLRMVDHGDFFTSAAGVLVTVLDHSQVAYHARTPFDAHYTAYREDVAADQAYLGRKWSQWSAQ